MQIFKIGNVQFEIPSQGFVVKVNFEIKFELLLPYSRRQIVATGKRS